MKISRLFCLIELAAVAALYFFENNSGTRAALACKTPSRGRKRAPPPSWGKPFPCPFRTAVG